MKIDRKKYLLARARACKSHKDLLDIGLSRGTITRINAGDANVLPETVGRIAKLFGCDVADLVDTDDM